MLIFFRHEIWAIATTWLRSLRDLRCARIPTRGWAGTCWSPRSRSGSGLVFEQQIESGARDLWLIGTVLIVFALVLGYADRHGRHEREISELSTRDGILIGLAQSLALIPRVALGRDERRPAARARAAGGGQVRVPAGDPGGGRERRVPARGDHLRRGGRRRAAGYVALATVIAFAVGYAAIAWFLRYLAHHPCGCS